MIWVAIAVRHGERRMSFLQQGEKLRYIDSLGYGFVDIKHIIGTILAVIFFIKGQSESAGVVIRFPQLINVPVSVHVAQDHDPHIGAITFDFLKIPQRERVIVAACEEYRPRRATA